MERNKVPLRIPCREIISNMEKHRICQKAGREQDFIDYKITVVTPLRCYTMTMRDEAPADANRYFNI